MTRRKSGHNGAEGPESKVEPSQKTYQKILQQEITEGLRELERPSLGLFISAVSAGLEVSFSVFLMAVMLSLVSGQLSRPVVEILVANMYSIGFIFVVLGRSELFTEHTTRAVYPVLSGRASVPALLRLWALIYAGNLVGSAVFAKFIVVVGPALGVIGPSALGEIGMRVVSHPWWVILLSGVLAGWMMGLLSWLVTAGRDTISQVVFVWLITWAIGISHLHHAIVGSAEVLAAVFAGQGVDFAGFRFFLLWATMGNTIGGGFFVALLKYSHVIRSGNEPAPVRIDDLKAGNLPNE